MAQREWSEFACEYEWKKVPIDVWSASRKCREERYHRGILYISITTLGVMDRRWRQVMGGRRSDEKSVTRRKKREEGRR